MYTLVLLIGIPMMPAFTYEHWTALFNFYVGVLPVGQILATLAFVALAWHAWIGVRDIWMDYVKPVGLRLVLQVLTIPLAGRFGRLLRANPLEHLSRGLCHEIPAAPPV